MGDFILPKQFVRGGLGMKQFVRGQIICPPLYPWTKHLSADKYFVRSLYSLSQIVETLSRYYETHFPKNDNSKMFQNACSNGLKLIFETKTRVI